MTKKTLFCIFAILTTIPALFFMAVWVTCLMEYGSTADMGNEAYGFYTFFMMAAFVFTIPSIIFWYLCFKQKKTNNKK